MRRDHGRTLFSLSLSLSLRLSHLPSIQLLLPTENRYKERERESDVRFCPWRSFEYFQFDIRLFGT